MKFKVIVRIKHAGDIVELDCETRDTYEEAIADGEIAKRIFDYEFIDYRVIEI